MAVFLAVVMCLQMSEMSIFAVEAYNQASQIDLTVPELLKDGNNYFFIPQSGYSVGKKARISCIFLYSGPETSTVMRMLP